MKKWIVCLVIGLGMLAFSTGTGINDDTIRCGSEVMSPGDVCEETRGGSVTDTETYEEMKESKEAGQRTFNSWGRWVLLGGGLLLTGLGIWGIVKVKRARKNEPHLGPGHTPDAQPAPQLGPPLRQYPPPYPHYSPFQEDDSRAYPTYGPSQEQGWVPHPNYGPSPQQGPAAEPNYLPPHQQNVPPHQYPQQPFGPGSQ
jgi:hypothetical protein